MKSLAILWSLAVGAAACGCVKIQVNKFSAFDRASKMASLDFPRLVFAERVDLVSLPSMVAYAGITTVGGSREKMPMRIWARAAELNADLVVILAPRSPYAGYVASYPELGISSSVPIYSLKELTGICFRRCKARIGLTTDLDGTVTQIGDNDSLRKAGPVEGDRLLSVNGTPWPIGGAWHLAPRHALILALEPGQELSLVWIRPGAGRMEGKALALPNSGSMPANSIEFRDLTRGADE